MSPFRSLVLLLISLIGVVASVDAYHSILWMVPRDHTLSRSAGGGGVANDYSCESWRLSVETNNAGRWQTVPRKCTQFVKKYFNRDWYSSDSKVVTVESLYFASTVTIKGDGKDIWIFDVDKTLLSNLPYYAIHGYGF